MFELDLRSREPIYEQLVAKFKQLIISRVLKPDQQLPPVRVLAGDLTVNPNTIQKAYRELEYQGYIYSLPGKGHFVQAAVSEPKTAQLKKLEQELLRIVAEMKYWGLSQDDILTLIRDTEANKGGSEAND
ncbi:MAG: GntR family transcriptional regulator [Syntrophomonadaceae bacterium]|jgi:GntR family transcriptional regulator